MAADHPPENKVMERMPPPPGPGPGARWTLVHVMFLVLASALFIRLVVLIGPQVIVIGAFAIPVLIYAFALASSGRREAEQDALLWALATAAGRGMPLGPAVEAVADPFRGRSYRAASALTWALDAGVPLSEALERVPGAVPPQAALLIRVGEATGLLPQALREAVDARGERPPSQTSARSRIAYLAALLIVIQSLTGFIAYFIIPKFEAIFADFGVPLPEATIFTIQASRAAAESGALPVLTLIEVAMLVYLGVTSNRWTRRAIPLMFDRLSRARHSSLILRSLAVVVEGNRPLAVGIETLAGSYPRRWARRRLERVGGWLAEGADPWVALRGSGLIRPHEESILSAAARAGNLPWALREVAESGERRLNTRWQAASQILFVLTILAVGGLVLLLALAYFGPIVTLIEALIE